MEKLKINFNTENLDKKINAAKEIFSPDKYQDFEFDLSRLNLIDASKTALLLSVELMKKNTKSKINCIVKDNDTLNIIKPRKLKNISLSVNLGETAIQKLNIQNKFTGRSRKQYYDKHYSSY